MTDVLVIVPVLNRPERVELLRASLAASKGEATLHPLFVVSVADTATQEALGRGHIMDDRFDSLIVSWTPGKGDYARKVNYAYRYMVDETDTPWAFLGADDLHFNQGWADAALEVAASSGACVVGTNDYGNPTVKRGQHATHSLVHRDYLECGTMDEDGLILHEGYDHNFVDNEFVETARKRKTFAFAAASIVEHLHPVWKKGDWDETYEKGQRDFDEDRLLWIHRSYALRSL